MEMMNVKKTILSLKVDGVEKTGCISYGFHTFDELYDHRITLYIALCKVLESLHTSNQYDRFIPWRSLLHSDGTCLEGWFTLGIGREKGKQITYHLPLSRWDETNFAETLERGPEFDGHTPEDVLKRLAAL